ncbi:MAG: hypothetical protein IT427_18215 [Pirellulales bacterium]|nr:hypothetical protein [Pirellulales bacterium]
MYKSLVRGVLAVYCVWATLAPATSQACWLTHCFSCCKPKPPATYCPPPAIAPAAPACAVCPQQVNYVPQTCYRAVETCVPCTSCRPETVCDPCTGCPQTVMRPVTTYVRRQVMVPYTSYRPVVSPVVAASPCATCTGAAYNSPYYTGAALTTAAPAIAVAPSGCANCASGYAATPAASAPLYGAAPAAGQPIFSQPITGQPTTVQPLLSPGVQVPTPATPPMSPSGSSQPPNTFDNGTTPPSTGTGSQSSFRSIPDASRLQTAPPYHGGTPDAPALLPAAPDRTTARPLYRAASILPAIFGDGPVKHHIVRPASATRVIEPAPQPIDDGWRPIVGR